MRNVFWMCLIAVACQLPNKSENPAPMSPNAYAQLFHLRIENTDTTLYIFNGTDTISIQKKSSPTFCLGSTTQWGYFHVLELENRIAGMTFPNTIENQEFQSEYVSSGKIKDLQINGAEMDWEWLLTYPADYYLFSPFDESACERLASTPMSCVPFCDYLEPHPLGRLEWIKVIGWLNGKYPSACAYFEKEKNQYESLIKSASNESVLIGSFDDKQFWINSNKSHVHQIIKDSGHLSTLNSNKGNTPLDQEQLWELLPQIQHVILIGTAMQQDQAEKQLRDWKMRFGNHGYYINTSVTSYFEMGPLQPSLLLQNLLELPSPQSGFIQKID